MIQIYICIHLGYSSGSYVIKERSGRGNVSSATLVSIDTTDISDGNYTVNVVAEDLSGNLTDFKYFKY